MKLLLTGDLHIGRRPARIPQGLSSEFAPAHLWERIAEEAVSQDVDAVLLAGDVVEESNRFLEARPPLEHGLNRLREAGVPVVAVSGNHDWDVLRRLADSLSGDQSFHLLGPDGGWERAELRDDDGISVHIFGRSFPERHAGSCPTDAFPAQDLDPGVPTIGLLHAELQGGDARYCPVTPAELQATGVPVWFVGHIHAPTDPDSRLVQQEVMYLGSPMGLDPGIGECGPHGVWIATLEGASWNLRMRPLSPLRYERLALDLEPVEAVEDLPQFVDSQLRGRLAQWRDEQPALAMVVLRLAFAGVTALPRERLCRAIAEVEDQLSEIEGVSVLLDDWDVDVTPPVDAEVCARGTGPLAVAAALLLELEGERPERRETTDRLQELQRQMQSLQGRSLRSLGEDVAPPGLEECRRLMRHQCRSLVSALYEQSSEGSHE